MTKRATAGVRQPHQIEVVDTREPQGHPAAWPLTSQEPTHG